MKYFCLISLFVFSWGALSRECQESKEVLHQEFMVSQFGKDRSTVGEDQIEPIKKRISTFIQSDPNIIVSDVLVTVSTSHMPFYKTLKSKKKVLDPESDKRNLALVKERAEFARKVLGRLKASSSLYKKINFKVQETLAGPDFRPLDLNTRFVTPMTPGYYERAESLFKKNEKLYAKEALKKDIKELLNEKEYGNLYQVKFKPFHGFKIEISGYRKDKMKCPPASLPSKETPNTSRQ